MALSTTSVPNNRNGRSQGGETAETRASNDAQEHRLHLNEVAGILRMGPEQVLQLSRANANLLSNGQGGDGSNDSMLFTHSDLAILINAQQADRQQSSETAAEESSENGLNSQEKRPIPLREHMSGGRIQTNDRDESKDEQGEEEVEPSDKPAADYQGYVPSRFEEFRPAPRHSASSHDGNERVNSQPSTEEPRRESGRSQYDSSSAPEEPPQQPTSDNRPNSNPPSTEVASEQLPSEKALPVSADKMLGEMLSTVANSQKSVLNVQDSIREMLNVIAQDNFNLKHENRKLRERMLELERIISEHQRREETRKEMLESRMRAVEGTLSALQQQLAQLVQLQRQRIRKHWFK